MQYAHGFGGDKTLSLEAIAGNRYQAFSAGLTGLLGHFGALEVDAAVSSYRDGDSREQGASMRLLWAKAIAATGTSVQMIGARHASPGFMDMNAAIAQSSAATSRRSFREKHQLQLQFSQSLGPLQLNASLAHRSAWDSDQTQLTRSLSAAMKIGPGNLTFSIDRSRGTQGPLSQRWTLDWQMPLWPESTGSRGSLSLRRQQSPSDGNADQLSISGGDSLRYNVSASDGKRRELDLYLSRSGSFGNGSASISHSDGNTSYSASLNGGLAIHGDGLTFGQPLGESSALVYTGGVAGVAVAGQTDVVSDRRGYALLPWLGAYRENEILLDPSATPDRRLTEIEATSRILVPSRGALVRVDFKASRGLPVLFTIVQADGKPVPLGARLDLGGAGSSWVGQSGMSYVLASEGADKGVVIWGTHRCAFTFSLTASDTLQRRELTCHE